MFKKILVSQLPLSPWWGLGMPVYENDPAMHEGDIPDSNIVIKEHANVIKTLTMHADMHVKKFPLELDSKHLYRHDAIFTRDAFISNQKGEMVISNFKDKRRQPEATHAAKYLKAEGFKISHLENNAIAEGGEFYYSAREDILFAGLSRNNKNGINATVRLLKIKHVCVIVSNAYHLDTFFTILCNSEGHLVGVIGCLALIENKAELKKVLQQYSLKFINIDIIDTIGTDGSGYITVNTLALPGKLIGGGRFKTPGVEEKIKALGIKHITVPVTQFRRSGGGVHCLTNELI